MRSPKDAARDAEHSALPSGSGERFAGYGVMGLTFASGHVLAMRRFTASSVGPGYTSVWHRTPDGRWAFWADQPDENACPRYFSTALSETRTIDIALSWPDETTLRVDAPAVGLAWTSRLTATRSTRVMNALGRAMPDRAWRSPGVLKAMGPVAGIALRAQKVAMVGTSPNGNDFIANPQTIWVIDESSAQLQGDDFGTVGPLPEQARLGDFWIPQRGIFAIGRAFFDVDGA